MKSLNSKLFAVAVTLASTVSIASAQSDHVARIPAGSDLSSIRFQGIKMVTVPVGSKVANDARYCEQAALRDPGGSMYCPSVRPAGFERMYQVTYSYEGRPLASVEYGNTHHTFSVNYRPEELSPAQQAMFSRKGTRADAAGSFELTMSKELDTRQVVDNSQSTFCKVTYVDGVSTHADPKCEDNIQFKTIAVPSDYIAIRVELARARGVAAAE